MMRGTFANIRLRNLIDTTPPGPALAEGGVTRYFGPSSGSSSAGSNPSATDGGGEQMSIYDAAMRYIEANVPLVVLGGKEYGSGSSRDWAAKGTKLLGVRAVIVESFERIHRSNLVGMGVLPLQFPDGQSADSLGLTGEEVFSIEGIAEAMGSDGPPTSGPPREVRVLAVHDDPARPEPVEFQARVRIDTPREAEYFRHGGILQFVLRALLST
jgi:aconitate hydratase